MSWTHYGFGVPWVEVVFNIILVVAGVEVAAHFLGFFGRSLRR